MCAGLGISLQPLSRGQTRGLDTDAQGGEAAGGQGRHTDLLNAEDAEGPEHQHPRVVARHLGGRHESGRRNPIPGNLAGADPGLAVKAAGDAERTGRTCAQRGREAHTQRERA